MMIVRLKVKDVALRLGISQRKLSMRSGVDINAVRRIFNDPFVSVKTETLGKLASALNVDVSELIESVPDEHEVR
jgi:DNA-binding Xre family transcriptional regulator